MTPARGFTLLELLVVMVVIRLLASYVAPRYFDKVGTSEVKATRAQLDSFEKALVRTGSTRAAIPAPSRPTRRPA